MNNRFAANQAHFPGTALAYRSSFMTASHPYREWWPRLTVYSVHGTLYSVQCTLYIGPHKRSSTPMLIYRTASLIAEKERKENREIKGIHQTSRFNIQWSDFFKINIRYIYTYTCIYIYIYTYIVLIKGLTNKRVV